MPQKVSGPGFTWLAGDRSGATGSVHALPVTIPALTVNRVCGSGVQAIVSAAQEIALGNIDVAVAGGMENMDLAARISRLVQR